MKQRIQQRLELSFILKRREELRGHSAPCKAVRAGEPPRRGHRSAACRCRMAVHLLSQFPVWSRMGRERPLPSGSQAVCSSYNLHVYFPSRFELSQVSARGLASLSCANMNHSLAPASNRAAAPGTRLWGSPGAWVLTARGWAVRMVSLLNWKVSLYAFSSDVPGFTAFKEVHSFKQATWVVR